LLEFGSKPHEHAVSPPPATDLARPGVSLDPGVSRKLAALVEVADRDNDPLAEPEED